jgi:hypothetical protein
MIMTAGKPIRSHDRLERLARSMLAIALLVAVAYSTGLLSLGA